MFRSYENNILGAGFSSVSGYNREEHIATAVAGDYMNHSLIELSTIMIKIVRIRKEANTLY